MKDQPKVSRIPNILFEKNS